MFPPIAQLDATFVASPAVLFLAPIAAAEGRRSRIALGSRRFPLLYTCYSATILDALRSNLMAVLVCLARFILYLPAYRCGARLATISCGAGIVHESRAAVGEPSTESMSCAGRLKRRLIAGGLCFAFLTVAAGGSGSGGRFPAYSGGTAWDLHPLRVVAGMSREEARLERQL